MGIPIKFHLNWLITAVLVTWSLAAGYFPQVFPGWKVTVYWFAGSITSFFFFGSVLAHELAHAIVAHREGIPVRDITLFILGGLANITEEPDTPIAEFRIVVAGPLTSLLLSAGFLLVSLGTSFSQELSSVAIYLCEVNLLLALFNMIPGLPLDGGRILRSILWNWMEDFDRATRWGSVLGLIFGLGISAAGIALMFSRNYFAGLWITFVGWYLVSTAQASYRQTRVKDQNVAITIQDLLGEPEPVLQCESVKNRLAKIELPD
jgi:Zn-dependent protease